MKQPMVTTENQALLNALILECEYILDDVFETIRYNTERLIDEIPIDFLSVIMESNIRHISSIAEKRYNKIKNDINVIATVFEMIPQ